MYAGIKAIEYYLPTKILTNEQLATEFPAWTVDKIEAKVGIVQRHIAADNEFSSDLAYNAACKLMSRGICSPKDIDFLLLCTQSPDYFLPTTACILQDRLGLPTTTGALDFNLGCSGYIYGLGLAKGLIETGQARTVLLITSETYSKFIHPEDRSVRTIFGDGAAATLVQAIATEQQNQNTSFIGPFVYGTDGKGANNLIVRNGGMRYRRNNFDATQMAQAMGFHQDENLYMNGAEIFSFTLQSVPEAVNQILAQTGKTIDEIDLFVFHQANEHMLTHLRKKLKIPNHKFYIALKDFGNTVSATIPIALCEANKEGKLLSGQQIMLVGFGVGYSWGVTIVKWFDKNY